MATVTTVSALVRRILSVPACNGWHVIKGARGKTIAVHRLDAAYAAENGFSECWVREEGANGYGHTPNHNGTEYRGSVVDVARQVLAKPGQCWKHDDCLACRKLGIHCAKAA